MRSVQITAPSGEYAIENWRPVGLALLWPLEVCSGSLAFPPYGAPLLTSSLGKHKRPSVDTVMVPIEGLFEGLPITCLPDLG